jgi:PilZ domain-containing protein
MSPRGKQLTPRHRRRVEVRYAEGDRPPMLGYSGNISMTGMMLRTPRVHPPGTILHLEVRFPQRTLTLVGKVMWAREGPMAWLATGRVGMGIRFVNPPAELDELVRAQAASTGTERS